MTDESDAAEDTTDVQRGHVRAKHTGADLPVLLLAVRDVAALPPTVSTRQMMSPAGMATTSSSCSPRPLATSGGLPN